jgi:hypothetical protein
VKRYCLPAKPRTPADTGYARRRRNSSKNFSCNTRRTEPFAPYRHLLRWKYRELPAVRSQIQVRHPRIEDLPLRPKPRLAGHEGTPLSVRQQSYRTSLSRKSVRAGLGRRCACGISACLSSRVESRQPWLQARRPGNLSGRRFPYPTLMESFSLGTAPYSPAFRRIPLLLTLEESYKLTNQPVRNATRCAGERARSVASWHGSL